MEPSYVDHALERYQTVQSLRPYLPVPTRSASYEVHHNGRHYIVLARDARRILGLYQVVHGVLRVMGSCPHALRQQHRARVLGYVHDCQNPWQNVSVP
jgi:hypothetical protein